MVAKPLKVLASLSLDLDFHQDVHGFKCVQARQVELSLLPVEP